MEKDCYHEVEEMHRFIEAWMLGCVEQSKAEFQQFECALDDEFVIVRPDGNLQRKTAIVSDFWNAHGIKWPGPFAITIKNFAPRVTSTGLYLVTYEEWHSAEKEIERLSTVLFKQEPRDKKIRWVHLHEMRITCRLG